MIALQFAPIPTTGAHRVIEFVKLLPSLGVRPVVLTIDPTQAEQIFGARRNMVLLDDLPQAVRVEYIRASSEPRAETKLQQLLRMLTTFNDTFERRFSDHLRSTAERLALEHKFAAVYSTAPPFGAAGLGTQVAEALRLPYLLDMRDAWAQWSPSPEVSRFHYRRKAVDERRAFAAADKVIGVTAELVELFRTCHPDIPRDRFSIVTNGFSNVDVIPDEVVWADEAPCLNVGYVGSFYFEPPKTASLRSPNRLLQYDPGKEDWSYRSPLYFFRAWQALNELDPTAAARIRFHLVGRTPQWLSAMASDYGVLDKCVLHGFKPRDEIPAFLESMTGLLATSMKRIDGDDYCLASKTFEYLSSGKPTLAFVCQGSQKRFFESAGGAFFFDPDDAESSAVMLQSLVGKSQTLRVSKIFLEAYAMEKTAEQMAHHLKRLATLAGTDHNHAA